MEQHKLVGKDIKLVLKENVLAVLSSNDLSVISSAIHNGGCKRTKTIINTQVFDEYGDRRLHDDPVLFIIESSKKLGNFDDFVGMVTYASIKDFSLVSKTDGDLAVSVIATAGCTHAESSGEEIEIHEIPGTINIIVIIDGNPTTSCLASTLISAIEAKTAALRDLDLRSRYSGDEATGTITDALVTAKTGRGLSIVYGGPASKLGNLIGACTRKAVKDAVTKAKVGGFPPSRSIIRRLTERHLSTEKLALEASKIKGLSLDANKLEKMLKSKPVFATLLFAAAKLDDDIKKGLIPKEFGNVNLLSSQFSDMYLGTKKMNIDSNNEIINQIESIDLPPFTKQVLITFLMNTNSKEKNENLK
jgi:adenosylcobinamide amidohydrolase